MENCVIYARFSSHGQNEQSIEAQVRICKDMPKTKVLMLSTFIQIKQEQEQTTLDLHFRK